MAESAQVSESDSGIIEMVEFHLGDRPYALEVSEVDSVEQHKPPTRVPRAAEAVVGTVDIRGEVVVVIDPKVALGIETDEEGKRLIMLDPAVDNQRLALLVDSVTGVEPFTGEAFEAIDSIDLPGEELNSDVLTGMLRPSYRHVDDEDGEMGVEERREKKGGDEPLIGLLDLQAIISEARIELQ